MEAKPVIIGWREWVALPELGIARIRAKTDTGARTSALHVESIEPAGPGRVRFGVVVRERPKRRVVVAEAPLVREAVVKPSSGERSTRPIVQVLARFAGVEREVEVGLVCREGMLCRMLLGRRALEGLLVDPTMKYLHGRTP